MNLEDIMLNGISQWQKDKHSMILLIIRYLKQSNSSKLKKEWGLFGWWEEGRWELSNGYKASVTQHEKILDLLYNTVLIVNNSVLYIYKWIENGLYYMCFLAQL